MDRDVESLKIYCPNKNRNGCGWTGEIARVDDHLRGCKISCSKCKQIVYFSTMKSHLDTECPCYCPYCDITAEREVISSEHKERCHKFPLTCPNNIGVDNVPCDKFDKANNEINELQDENVNDVLVSSILIEQQNNMVREEATQSLQIARECSDKINKPTNSTMFSKLYDNSHLTIAVLIIAILIPILVRSHYSNSELQQQIIQIQKKFQEQNTQLQQTLQEQNTQLQKKLTELQEKFQEQNTQFQKKFTQPQEKFQEHNTQLQEKVQEQNIQLQEVQQYYHQLSSSVWSMKLWLSSELSDQVAPAIVKMSNFTKELKHKKHWHSSPFFAFEGGYQMHLNVDVAGSGIGEDTHVSVYLFLMKGPHDDELEQSGHWPLRGTFIIELLNQLNDSDHHICMVQFHQMRCSICAERVTGIIRASADSGYGNPQFISYDTLLHHSNNGYHKNDFLIFRISYEHMEAPYQVAPITIKVPKFSYWLESKEEYYSNPFFAFEGGYQMSLRVYAAGNGNGEGTHVSVFLFLMKGPHDDELERSGHWPLRGTFTIELLNQLNDSDHYSHMVQFHHHIWSKCTNRVLDAVAAYDGLGQQQFMPHQTLYNNGYIENNSLIFRISYESTEPPYQIAPVSFKLTNFSQWFINKDLWSSGPFFAFNGGYLIYLIVDAAGHDDESTHVSVDLYLMKGPHDDKLEQSGHWPLRGTFTIELLNQLNDSDHHQYTVKYGAFYNFPRVKVDDEDVIEAIFKFISHDTLFQHNGYLNNDMLQFRVSYSANSDGSNEN